MRFLAREIISVIFVAFCLAPISPAMPEFPFPTPHLGCGEALSQGDGIIFRLPSHLSRFMVRGYGRTNWSETGDRKGMI